MTEAEKKKEIARLQEAIKNLDPNKPSTAQAKRRMQRKLKALEKTTSNRKGAFSREKLQLMQQAQTSEGRAKITEEEKKTQNKGGSTTAAERAAAISNSGQSLAKKPKVATKKPKVAEKTIVGNEYSSKLKRNLSDFEQAYINARRAGKKTFPFKGQTISSDLDTRPMKKSK